MYSSNWLLWQMFKWSACHLYRTISHGPFNTCKTLYHNAYNIEIYYTIVRSIYTLYTRSVLHPVDPPPIVSISTQKRPSLQNSSPVIGLPYFKLLECLNIGHNKTWFLYTEDRKVTKLFCDDVQSLNKIIQLLQK